MLGVKRDEVLDDKREDATEKVKMTKAKGEKRRVRGETRSHRWIWGPAWH